MIKKIIQHVRDENHAEFRKDYLKAMQENYDKKKQVVKNYCYSMFSNGKETNI